MTTAGSASAAASAASTAASEAPYTGTAHRNVVYPGFSILPRAPQTGSEGYANALRVQGTLREPCPEWEPPEPGTVPPEDKKYITWRKRFMLWAEGELMLQVPPGLIASALARSARGDAGKALLDIERNILCRPRIDARAATDTRPAVEAQLSGLEIALKLLDDSFGQEQDQEEEKTVGELDNYWRNDGVDMANFRLEFWRRLKRPRRTRN